MGIHLSLRGVRRCSQILLAYQNRPFEEKRCDAFSCIDPHVLFACLNVSCNNKSAERLTFSSFSVSVTKVKFSEISGGGLPTAKFRCASVLGPLLAS